MEDPLFVSPANFDDLRIDEEGTSEVYRVHYITPVTDFPTSSDQERTVEVLFDKRQPFTAFQQENFDVLYSFVAALPAGTVFKAARGLLGRELASTLLILSQASLQGIDRRRRAMASGADATSTQILQLEQFLVKARNAVRMCVCLLSRVLTAPVNHAIEEDDAHRRDAVDEDEDDAAAATQRQLNANARHKAGAKQKKPRGAAAANALDTATNDGIEMDSKETALRAFTELLSDDCAFLWAVEQPGAADHPATAAAEAAAAGAPSAIDGNTATWMLRAALHVVRHPTTFIPTPGPLARGTLDTLRRAARIFAYRHAVERAGLATATAAPSGGTPDAAAAAPGADGAAPAAVVVAADPVEVIVQPLLDVLLQAPVVLHEPVAIFIVQCLVAFDADTTPPRGAPPAPPGVVTPATAMGQLVGSFIETITTTALNIDTTAKESKETKQLAKLIETIAKCPEVMARGGAEGLVGADPMRLLVRQAPMLTPLLQCDAPDIRKSAITAVVEVVSHRYAAQTHAWARAGDDLTGASTANADASTVAGTMTGPAGAGDADAGLRDQYLVDIAQRFLDLNAFVRNHCCKEWELLVRRRAVSRGFQAPLVNAAVGRILDRHPLVRSSALSLLGAILRAGWFGEALPHSQLVERAKHETAIVLQMLMKSGDCATIDDAVKRFETMRDDTRARVLQRPGAATASATAAAGGAGPGATPTKMEDDPDDVMAAFAPPSSDAASGSPKRARPDAAATSMSTTTTVYDGPLLRVVFFETAANVAESMEVALALATDLLASKTMKDVVDAVQFITAAAICRLEGAAVAMGRAHSLVFHYDPTVVNAIGDAFMSVYISSIDSSAAAAGVSTLVKHVARCKKLIAAIGLSDTEAVAPEQQEQEGAAAVTGEGAVKSTSYSSLVAIERIIEVQAAKRATAAAALRVTGANSAAAAAASTAVALLFSREFLDALWGVIEGTLDPSISSADRCCAVKLFGMIARHEPREIALRRADIVRLIMANHRDNALLGACFHVLAFDAATAIPIDNTVDGFDLAYVPLNAPAVAAPVASNRSGRGSHSGAAGEMLPVSPMLQAVKLAVLHLGRPSTTVASWNALAEGALTFLQAALTAPTHLSVAVVSAVGADVDKHAAAVKRLSAEADADTAEDAAVSPTRLRDATMQLLARRSQFMFLLGHSAVKHLVLIEEYEKRELAGVTTNSATGADDDAAPAVGRSSTSSTVGGAGRRSAAGAGQGAKEDAMHKELGLGSTDYRRQRIRDRCTNARALMTHNAKDKRLAEVAADVPSKLRVPHPVWSDNAAAVAALCRERWNTILAAAAKRQPDVPLGALHSLAVLHRSACTVALVKLMVASPIYCQEQLPLLFTVLAQPDEPWEVKTGIVIGLGDLACVHPNLLAPYLDLPESGFYALLADRDTRVRSVAVQVCTHLVMNDMLQIGDHLHTIVRLVADPDPVIKNSADLFVTHLASKRNKELHNIIPPLVAALSLPGAGVLPSVANKDTVASNKKAAPASKKTAGKSGEKQQSTAAELLPPMPAEYFRIAVQPLLDGVDRARGERLMTKLCERFQRYDDRDLHLLQLHRNIAFCLAALPYDTEREVRCISAPKHFERYKDWLRDVEIAESFEKIANKARRNANPGRAGAAGAAAAEAQQTQANTDPNAPVALVGDRRDRVLIDEWAAKILALREAAAPTVAAAPATADAAGNTQQRPSAAAVDAAAVAGDLETLLEAGASPALQESRRSTTAASPRPKAASRRKRRGSSDEESDSSAAGSSEQEEEETPPQRGRRGAAAASKSQKQQPAAKRAAARIKKEQPSSSESSEAESSEAESDEETPVKRRGAKKAPAKKAGARR